MYLTTIYNPPGVSRRELLKRMHYSALVPKSLENSATLRDLRLQASKISFNTEYAGAFHTVLDPDKYL